MDAGIMPDNTTLIRQLEKRILKQYKHVSFCLDIRFYWSASRQEVHFKPAEDIKDIWELLHEIAHAELRHNDFTRDIQLLRHEMAAWQHAKLQIAPHFTVSIDDNFAEAQLDSYRDWLHERSRCPKCTETGIQQTTSIYQCINCLCSWLVNDARLKRLRRTMLSNQNRFE
ncbi:MAG TPA: hypothetical protein VFZ58_02610 [Candidatus Saccharimonadales bacterium]